MATNKKYTVLLVEDGTTWTAQIARRASARKTIISKSQDGFASQEEAQAWGDEQLVEFAKIAQAKNKRS